MNLRDAYLLHFAEGGAYRRAAWPSGTYWHLNSPPRYYNDNVWQGVRIVLSEQVWNAYPILIGTEDAADDWSWVDQQTINNATIAQKNRDKANEDSIL